MPIYRCSRCGRATELDEGLAAPTCCTTRMIHHREQAISALIRESQLLDHLEQDDLRNLAATNQWWNGRVKAPLAVRQSLDPQEYYNQIQTCGLKEFLKKHVLVI